MTTDKNGESTMNSSTIEKFAEIEQKLAELQAKGPKEGEDEYFQYITGDQVDGKMQALLEKLKNEN